MPLGTLDACRPSTIQLPIYNEMYVADRLIDAVCRIDYPRELLEIQVLDDSTDETCGDRANGRSTARPRRGSTSPTSTAPIAPATRPGRSKRACRRRGASSSRSSTRTSSRRGISCAHGPVLQRPTVGMVQVRWGHLNRDYSLLTKIQSILLDGHFVIEHDGAQPRGTLLQLQRHGRHLAAARPSTMPAAGSTTR